MRLETLVQCRGLSIPAGAKGREVLGVVCDSRQVKPGFLFVAIPGKEKDGFGYIEDALARGAAVIVSEREIPSIRDAVVIRVDSARASLGFLAAAFYGMPSSRLNTIGITGTNGKTTTAFVCRDILRRAGRNPGLIGTIEYQIGPRLIPASRTTPDAATLQAMLGQMVNAGCGSVVMEVSSHALDQGRVNGTDFDVGVFTNLTGDHLDYHLTMENYFDAKLRLFDGLGQTSKKAHAVINRDDAWGRRLSERALRADVVTFGADPAASVRIVRPDITMGGSSFLLETPWGSRQVRTNLVGRYNVSNVTAAIVSCAVLGISFDLACDCVGETTSVPGRLEEVPTGRGFRVLVDYAHTHDALENVLTTLREVTEKRLIVVFGCGGNRDKTKRPRMGSVAARLADFTILTSDNPRKEDPMDIIAQIRAGYGEGPHCLVLPDRREAIRKAMGMAEAGDVVLVAGKGHETFQEGASCTVPFDDRKVTAEAIAELGRNPG